MKYMIFDNEGNAIDSFTSGIAARASLRAIAHADRETGDDLLLVAYDDAGKPTGERMRVRDLPPTLVFTSKSITVETGMATVGLARGLNEWVPGVPNSRLTPRTEPTEALS